MPIANALSSVTSTHMRTHHHTAARPWPGAGGVRPPVNAPKNSTAAPMPNTVSPLRATPGRSCAVTGSRLFTFSPGTANTSTSASTSISSGRKISEARKSAFVLPSAPQTGHGQDRHHERPRPAQREHRLDEPLGPDAQRKRTVEQKPQRVDAQQHAPRDRPERAQRDLADALTRPPAMQNALEDPREQQQRHQRRQRAQPSAAAGLRGRLARHEM